ncbi:MAG: amino acid permease, partial [Bacteroidales bacterium]|nr:amino acid permease [Bacteroidales bacterium]
FAVGTVGFAGVLGILILGHLVTIPTALAISEIATNQKVEGGGEYFIISRSFGLNIGATIGIALYLSQAVSVAFYIIAFTEAFQYLFDWLYQQNGIFLPRQVISIPSMLLLALLILKNGAGIGVKTLYIIASILFLAILLFFAGHTDYSPPVNFSLLSVKGTGDFPFFIVFAIVFPAFTGMTAGVGLSGDLKNPGRAIPVGTITATITGMIIYVFISWKLAMSASPEDLAGNQLVMSNIAVIGKIIIPIGLAASTLSSAIGSILVAPRTLQALAKDRSLPLTRTNYFFSRGKGDTSEPFNATLITSCIALIFIALGNVNAVAQIISMFFMVTYGSLCLISFLYHFGADPSYRPVFKSRWYISLLGFLMCFWLMFQINTPYALVSIVLMILLYFLISNTHRERGGIQDIFQGAMFQISRNIHIFLQKSKKANPEEKWRPSAVCISKATLHRDKVLRFLDWIAFKYGFATYIHLVDGYYSRATYRQSKEMLEKLLARADLKSHVYLDTLISPSYTSAIAQIIQLPSISGMEYNMIIFEFDKENPDNLTQIAENIPLSKAGYMDVGILASSRRITNNRQGIHVWIRTTDMENSNLMILLSYVILGHPAWKGGKIKIFNICKAQDYADTKEKLMNLIQTGRLPIAPGNIEIIRIDESVNPKSLINAKSAEAGLTVLGFREEQLKHYQELFTGYGQIGDILFVNASRERKI